MTYASPEHLGRTQTDERSDIYSLGATMYHLLTNQEPTPLETPYPGKLRQYQPTLSPATEAAVIRSMQIDPSQRFQSVKAMRDALSQCLRLDTRPQAQVASTAIRQPPKGAPRGGHRHYSCGHAWLTASARRQAGRGTEGKPGVDDLLPLRLSESAGGAILRAGWFPAAGGCDGASAAIPFGPSLRLRSGCLLGGLCSSYR